MKTIILAFLSSIAVNGYCQSENNQIIFLDSMRNEVDPSEGQQFYAFNNGLDTIRLEPLFRTDFLRYGRSSYWGEIRVVSSLEDLESAEEIEEIGETEKTGDKAHYCVHCTTGEGVQIVDSIDINNDGIKEIFLFRDWNCYAEPPNPGSYGVGSGQLSFSTYEVWDLQRKRKLFEVKNRAEGSWAVSTNVMQNDGYEYAVAIDEDGSFVLSNPHGNGVNLEMGKYSFDVETGKYERE